MIICYGQYTFLKAIELSKREELAKALIDKMQPNKDSEYSPNTAPNGMMNFSTVSFFPMPDILSKNKLNSENKVSFLFGSSKFQSSHRSIIICFLRIFNKSILNNFSPFFSPYIASLLLIFK